MHLLIAAALTAVFTLGGDNTAPMNAAKGDSCCKAGGCPVAAKVTELVASWKQATEEMKAMPVAERDSLHARVMTLAADCPIGKRMGPTMVATRDVLGLLVASAETCAKSCPIMNATPEQKQTPAFQAALELVTARGKLLQDLNQLASYAGCCGSDASCKGATDKVSEPTGKTLRTEIAGDGAACAGAKVSDQACKLCPKELAERVAKLKASWATVGEDLAQMPAAKKEEMRKGFESLSASCKTIALMPATVCALADGFDALDSLHGKLGAWAEANPTVMANVSEEAKKMFEANNALVRETRDVLRRGADTIKGGSGCKEATPVGKGSTAQN